MSCDCIGKVNNVLKEHDIKAKVSCTIPLENGYTPKVLILLEKTGKAKVPILAATYCPFCGKKYQNAKEASNE